MTSAHRPFIGVVSGGTPSRRPATCDRCTTSTVIFGERSCAFLLVHDGIDIEFPELATFLLGFGLSKDKLPERVVCLTDFPRSPDGMVLKPRLADQLSDAAWSPAR